MSLSRKTLEHPVLALIVFFLLGFVSLFTIQNIALELFPDIDYPYVMVYTGYKNAGPETVEKSVTAVLESALVSVKGLKKISSQSSEGSSRIEMEFNYGKDLDAAVSEVRDKLDSVSRSLPDKASAPTIFRMSGNAWPIMSIQINANRSVDDIKQIAEQKISSLLEQIEGVAEVSVSGGRPKQVNVELSQNRLSAYGFTVGQVSAALGRQNLELGGGKLTDGNKNYVVRTTGEYSSIEEINDTVIASVKGYDVRLKDIGRAYLGFADKSEEVFINGQSGVYVDIKKQSGKNTVAVANAVYAKVEQLKKTLPPDFSLEIIEDTSLIIRETINTLVNSAWQGLLLAVLILFIFLRNIKSTVIIAISIPLSILITLLCMNFAGLTLNMMTLTGLILGVGMIVDASIVMIDNIYSYRMRGAKARIAAVLGSQEMVMSVVSGNLTTICVFLPFLFFIKQLEMIGQIFKSMIFTIVIALLASLFVAVFLVPVLSGVFLPLTNRNEHPVKNPALKWLYRFFEKGLDGVTAVYSAVLKIALNNRLLTILTSICLLIIAFALIPTMQISLFPMGNDDSVRLFITMPVGTPLEQTKSITLTFEDIIKSEISGYKTLTTSIGGQGTHSASIAIQLPETSEQIDNAQEIQKKLRRHFADFAGASFSFGQGFNGQLAGSDINIAVRSDDLQAASSVADKIKSVLEGIKDLAEPALDMQRALPQVEVVIDRERAYSFGVDVTTVAAEINSAINGSSATIFRSGGKEYSVVVQYQPSDRKRFSDLESMYVRGANGMVSLSNFASLKRGVGAVGINRENQTRIIRVTASIISGKNANLVEADIKKKIASSFIVPDNVAVSYEGSWQRLNTQMTVYLLILIMAVALVFGVMAATYESFKAPLINLATIPFLVIGVIFLYKIIAQPISIMAMVGMIMLVGIVVNNGIILVDYTNLLRGRGIPLKEACRRAGESRLRPVLMTTFTTILGMLPMCFASDGQSSFVQPIGIAVVGGLTSSTLVTLVFIPVLYSLVMKDKPKAPSAIKIAAESGMDGQDARTESGEAAAERTAAVTIADGTADAEMPAAEAAVLANADAEQAAQTADADIAKESDAGGATGEAESGKAAAERTAAVGIAEGTADAGMPNADAAVLASADAEQAAQTADIDIAKESDAGGATEDSESFGKAGEVANAPNA